jgi:hypothetical protein
MALANRRTKWRRATIWAATALAMVALVGGWAMASLTISQGATETGGGAYHGAAALSYWSETAVGIATQPSTLPTALSTTATGPTVLAGAATNYAINTPVTGDVAHYWKFTEAAGAPVSTEVEIQFSVSTGTTVTVTSVTDYIETQGTAPGTAIVFTLYYDLGNPSGGTITLDSVTQISQQCSGVGTCP